MRVLSNGETEEGFVRKFYAKLWVIAYPDRYRAYNRKYARSKTGKAYRQHWNRTPVGKRNIQLCNTRGRTKRKLQVFSHYGLSCARCGYYDLRALSIDHIDGYGAEHRRILAGLVGRDHLGSDEFYRWLITNSFPVGFQTLCMNCQFIKRHENGEYAKP